MGLYLCTSLVVCVLTLGCSGCQSSSQESPKKAEKSAMKKDSKDNLCQVKGNTVCTMQYDPAECTLKEFGLSSQGSNACAAKSALKIKICSKKGVLSREQESKIVCKSSRKP